MKKSEPISRVLSWTIISLGDLSLNPSSSLPRLNWENPVSAGGTQSCDFQPLFSFAPSGVCPAMCVTTHAVRSYRTFSPLLFRHFHAKKAVCFLWHFP